MAGMWIPFWSMISVARGQTSHGSGGWDPHQYRWAGVVWVARCRDVWRAAVGCGCFAIIRLLVNGAIGLLATKGDSHPDCSGQGEGRSFLVSSQASNAIAAVLLFQACLRAWHMYMLYHKLVCVRVYMCMYVCGRTCIYVYICMRICISIRMHVFTCVYVCVCIFVYRLWVSGAKRWRVGQCHGCACVFVCIHMRMYMCACIYVYAFLCSECCVHFWTGVLGTSACAGVNVIQVFVWHQRTHLRHTRCRVCTYLYMHIYMYVHAYVYG